MKEENVKYIVNINKHLSPFSLNIRVMDSEENNDNLLDVFLIMRNAMLQASPILKTKKIPDNDDLELNIIREFNLGFSYNDLEKEIALNAFSLKYSKIIETINSLKELIEDYGGNETVTYGYNIPDGTVLIVFGKQAKFIPLYKFDNVDEVQLELVGALTND